MPKLEVHEQFTQAPYMTPFWAFISIIGLLIVFFIIAKLVAYILKPGSKNKLQDNKRARVVAARHKHLSPDE